MFYSTKLVNHYTMNDVSIKLSIDLVKGFWWKAQCKRHKLAYITSFLTITLWGSAFVEKRQKQKKKHKSELAKGHK